MPHVNEELLDHAMKTGDFRYLSDWAEENEMPTVAKVLRQHYKNPHLPAHPDYLPDENGLSPRESLEHIQKSPQISPGVYMVPGHDAAPGNKKIGYWLHDLRKFQKPDHEDLYEMGADDTANEYTARDIHDWLHENPPSHYFHSSNRKEIGPGQYIQKRDKLDLAKPIPVYEDPGDEVHITGLSKGGNCEHCGKPDIYRIHVKHPVSGETCKIGSSCASGLLRDNSKRNLTGKMQPKDILMKAATAESLKDVGSAVKVRLKNKETKLTKDIKETLARKGTKSIWPQVSKVRKITLGRGISSGQDTHSQEEIYAALIAEGVDEAKAQELSHALS